MAGWVGGRGRGDGHGGGRGRGGEGGGEREREGGSDEAVEGIECDLDRLMLAFVFRMICVIMNAEGRQSVRTNRRQDNMQR